MARSADRGGRRSRTPFSHRVSPETREGDPIITITATITATATATATATISPFVAVPAEAPRSRRETEDGSVPLAGIVHVRELGPTDDDVLDLVFAGLSPRSRHLRFHHPVVELSAGTRRRLTAVDGSTHVALAAFADGQPIGIVRIVDLGDGRGELAVEVVDRWQGCGVGTGLLRAARDRATSLGYRELVAETLEVNTAAQAAVRRVFSGTRAHGDGSELTIMMPLDGDPELSRRERELVA